MANVLLNQEDVHNFIYVDFLITAEKKIAVFHMIFMAELIDVLLNSGIVKILIHSCSFHL